jgi:hypothetical protein
MMVFVALCSACNSSSPHLNLIKPGAEVAILAPAASTKVTSPEIHNQALIDSGTTGAMIGGIGYGAVGLGCGPLFWICVPLAATVGSLVGGATGVAVGTVQGLDEVDAKRLSDKLANHLAQHNPQATLLAGVMTRAQTSWTLVPPPAARQVEVAFASLGLQTKEKGPVVLVMQAVVIITYPDQVGRLKTRRQTFNYQGPPGYMESWLNDDGEYLTQRLNDAYQTLAENIVMALSSN